MTEPIKVFVSYAHKDKNSEKIKDDLSKYSGVRGIKLIYDTEEVGHADRITDFIKNKLIKGDHIILVFNAAYFNSHYCMRELLGIWKRGKEFYDRCTYPIITENWTLIDVTKVKEIWKDHENKDRLPEDFFKEIDKLIEFENQRNKSSFSKIDSENYAPLLDRIVKIPAWINKVHERSEKWVLNEKSRRFLLNNDEIDKFRRDMQDSILLLQNETVKQFLDASLEASVENRRTKSRMAIAIAIAIAITITMIVILHILLPDINSLNRSKEELQKQYNV